MITEAFMNLWSGLCGWLLGLFGDFQVPDWLTGFFNMLAQVVTGAYGLGAWVPWLLIVGVTTATFGLWGAGLLLTFVRWVWGLVPVLQ